MTQDEDAHGDAAGRLRIDRWLWCARFYKSRAQASEAVAGGRVHVNGARVKPSRALRIGDRVSVSVQPGREVEFEVRAIPERRGPAPEARACYEETPESVQRGVRWQESRRLAALASPRPEGRPDKRARRELEELARRQGRE
ncbi:MAG: S4 domain-containing protein [Steroidobacteraceae bacterium]|nr:S4 domain-containing protein [Steroidobacteraceae bacterium]